MDNRLFFSVIMPAYNSAAFLSAAVDSVLVQTDADFELILVDDGSTDETLSLFRAYAIVDARVRVLHKENGGHTSARNAGLACATGEYILFLDSDDSLAPDTLRLLREAIVSQNADIVVFGMQNRGAEKPFAVRVPDGCYDLRAPDCPLHESLVRNRDGLFSFPKSLSAKCFRRDIVELAQAAVPEGVLVGEDGAAFVGAMLLAERISVIATDARARYFCLVREGSVSRTADACALRRVRVLLTYYGEMLATHPALREQLLRDAVAHLYTAAVIALRAGISRKTLSKDFQAVLTLPLARTALARTRFSHRAWKLRIKRFLLRHRLWRLIEYIDR